MRQRLAALFLSPVLVAARASTSLAADVSADLHIDRVTVYRQGAVVTRAGDVAIPAGSNRLIVRGLPASVDSKTLRVTVEGGAVQLGGVSIRHYYSVQYPSGRELEQSEADAADDTGE